MICGSQLFKGTASLKYDSSTGRVLRSLLNNDTVDEDSGPPYHFDSPVGIIADRDLLLVENSGNSSITEIRASDGTFIRQILGITGTAGAAGHFPMVTSGSLTGMPWSRSTQRLVE